MRVIKEQSSKYNIDYSTCLSENIIAKIYRGQNKQSHVKIVLKQIDIAKCKSQEQAMMQGKLLKELNHPHIIKLYDTQANKKVYKMFLESAAYNLKSFVAKEKFLPKDTILNWCKQLVQAMIYLHSKKILHLDLKPQNIMLMANYSIRIIDFGQSLKGIRTKLAKNVKATPSYCPPFVLDLKDANQMIQFDQSFDVWSFGHILFDGTNKIKIKNEMKKFQTCWQQILSPQKIKQKIFRDILQKTFRINKQQKISFKEIKQMLDKQTMSLIKNNPDHGYLQQIQKTKIIPTMQIDDFHQLQDAFKTQRSYFISKSKIEQSKSLSILIVKYIEYYEFLISEANLLLKNISLDSDENGLAKVLSNYEMSVIKICLNALLYKYHNKLNEIVKLEKVQLPSGEKIVFATLHTMIRQQKIKPALKKVSQKYDEWKNNNSNDKTHQKHLSQMLNYIKNNPNQRKRFPPSDIASLIFQYPNKYMALFLKSHVFELQNIKFKEEINQFVRLKVEPIARRDIYFCSMISALNRILPQDQYHSNESKKYYNDLKDKKGDQLIKECLRNVLFNLN